MSIAQTVHGRCGDDERGSALVISMIAMSLMLMLGLATLALTDQQTRQSGIERIRESSFNLAEGALQQQSFLLGGKGWPRTSADALPVECTMSSDPALAANARCPTPSSLVDAAGVGAFDETDARSGASWSTKVRDNSAVNNQVYTDAIDSPTVPRYDANGDGFIWVKSRATVGTKKRTIVALLKRDPIPIFFPKAVLTAGALVIGQGGQPGVITTDATTKPVLRCPSYGGWCADYEPAQQKKDPQIIPDSVVYDTSFPNRLPATTLQQLRDSAVTYTSCPTEAQLHGMLMVNLPDDSMQCSYLSNSVFNSPSEPGMIIFSRGSFELRGTAQYYGALLHLNEGMRNAGATPAPPPCIAINGTNNIFGSIMVEGNCGAYINGSARLSFAPNSLNFSVTGVAGLVQNTWRELPSA